MPEKTDLEQAIFDEALRKSSEAERAAFLEGACRNDPQLRARLEMMLEGHLEAPGFLETLPETLSDPEATPPSEIPVSEQPGQKIGRYKLLQKIGEGGCGVVYMAEQEEPVRRRVALKVIKLGMDTKQVVTRFEAERQALALMDHPNIAKVFDAGATATGPREGDRISVRPAELDWQPMLLDDYLIDFNNLAGAPTLKSVAYAVSYIRSEVHQSKVLLLVRSDDQCRVYLNGDLVSECVRGRQVTDAEAVAVVELNAGMNVLVFKVVNEDGDWQGSIRFTDENGEPVQGLQVTLDPTAKKSR